MAKGKHALFNTFINRTRNVIDIATVHKQLDERTHVALALAEIHNDYLQGKAGSSKNITSADIMTAAHNGASQIEDVFETKAGFVRLGKYAKALDVLSYLMSVEYNRAFSISNLAESFGSSYIPARKRLNILEDQSLLELIRVGSDVVYRRLPIAPQFVAHNARTGEEKVYDAVALIRRIFTYELPR
ncbi:hypothetical protein HOD83_02880 [Candidatus Woesearchaeota archaeon]|jgi:hypothetical protein|nr:hypothetical protein [Candidatus Woesearchaeota archaeon]MBT4114610.1 hypothetical protein [Candidatus Woesearchaeota archaeon]MBT4248506.1 hypothetical protein [Candidatus Woesearchaeota archaeon]